MPKPPYNLIDKNKQYRERDLAYFAGIVDGEGSITITDSSHAQGRCFFSTSLGITSTDKVLIDWVVKTFGGWESCYTPKQTPLNSRKKVYRWQITGENLETMLNLILPYLIIKQQEAEIMLKMRKTFNGATGGVPLGSAIIDLRKQYCLELKTLHCRAYNNHKK
jgi:hypothetical protein